MSRMRSRPDESGKPGEITSAGYRRLEEEAERLWTVERPKLVRIGRNGAAEGDRSENAEYIYGKRKLAEIDRRLGVSRQAAEGAHDGRSSRRRATAACTSARS